ncbi:hypothetical protein V5799_026618 [Amblyomma americanum]|uniref:Uncharacterized protein n=1 Tax=Amblyomma americanum TaxID=6943 RepID=A0AAQ4DI28_AMBAM
MGKAGHFLTSYYRTCVETLPHTEAFLRSLASALVRHSWKSTEALNTKTAMVFILTATIKYHLQSAIQAIFRKTSSTISLKISAVCENDGYFLDAMAAVTDTLNERASTAVAPEVAIGFLRKTCQELSVLNNEKRRYVTKTDKLEFDKEVWTAEDLDAGLKECGYSLQDARLIDVVGMREIRLIHDQFALAKGNRTALVTQAAFLVWNSVISGVRTFRFVPTNSMPYIFDACLNSVSLFSEVWYTFAAESFTSPDKDAQARTLFATVKRVVHADCQSSRIFDAQDSELLHSFFNNLVLVTPIEASQISVTVPDATSDLGESLLRARLYDFDVVERREATLTNAGETQYHDVLFLGDRQLLVSASVYAFINASSGNHELANNALLGRLLAESMWYMVLTVIQWSSSTRSNIDHFKTCLAENYPGGNKTEASDDVLVAVLGLSSVLNVLSKSEWYMVRPAWSLWRISNAQFFFMLSAFYRCSSDWWPQTAVLVNTSVIYSEDFRNAFSCPNSEPMVGTRDCFLRTLPRG